MAEPLFFTPDEQYLYFYHRGVPDGCGIYFGGGNLVQVDLSSGAQTTLEDTAGVGHTLSPDGQRMAFLQGRFSNEFTLYLYDLNNGRTETVSFSLPGANAAAGSLIFSPDSSQIAFAAQQAYCGEGWTIGTVELATAELTIFPADDLAFWQPIDWVDDAIVLQQFNGEATKFLNPSTGEFLDERP
jgi:Tol biopolymer transport system component